MIPPTDPDPGQSQALPGALDNARRTVLGWLSRTRAMLSSGGGPNSPSLLERLDAHLRSSDRAPITVAALFGAGLIGLALLITLVVRWNRAPDARTVAVPPTVAPAMPTAGASAGFAGNTAPQAATHTPMPTAWTSAVARCAPKTKQIRPGECATLELDAAALDAFAANVGAIYLVHDESTTSRREIFIDETTEVCPARTTTYAWDIRLRQRLPDGRGRVAWCETTVEVIAGLARP